MRAVLPVLSRQESKKGCTHEYRQCSFGPSSTLSHKDRHYEKKYPSHHHHELGEPGLHKAPYMPQTPSTQVAASSSPPKKLAQMDQGSDPLSGTLSLRGRTSPRGRHRCSSNSSRRLGPHALSFCLHREGCASSPRVCGTSWTLITQYHSYFCARNRKEMNC